MSDEFQHFPTHQEALEAIERLKKITWPDFQKFENIENYTKEIENIIVQEFGIIPTTFQFFTPKDFNLSIFRARETNTIKNIDLISEHSYPPPNVTGSGRCNFPTNPVFYCSNHPLTCLQEVIRESDYKEREFCLTKWEIIDSNSPISIMHYFHSDLPKENGFNAIKEVDDYKIDEAFENKLDADKKAGLIELLKFIHTTFIQDTSHQLSAAIAHQVLYAKHNYRTDILLYPSIQTKLVGMNMALSPNFVDHQLQLKRLYKVKITDLNEKKQTFNLSIGDYAYVEKNVIMWQNAKENDSLFDKFYSLDFKSFMKRN